MRRVGVAILLFLLATACGGGTGGGSTNSEGTPKSGGVLTFALESELRTLDPVPCAADPLDAHWSKGLK